MRVVLDVTCRYDGNLPSVGVLISQRVGRTTTQSGADVTYEREGFLCIGAPQEVVLVVRVRPGQPTYDLGGLSSGERRELRGVHPLRRDER